MSAALLRGLDRLAGLLGCRLIPAWRLPGLPLATHLAELFERHRIDTVLDVGANRGQYRDFLRQQVGFRGRIHSFEPIAQLAQAMQARAAADPLWQVHACALGSVAGQAEIQVMASDTFSSLRGVRADSPAQFSASTQVRRSETIEIRRFDAVAEALQLPLERCYLKVDTQGFDLEVLAGAGAALQRIPALQVELALQRIYEGVPDYREVLTRLESQGLQVSGLFPISADPDLIAVELDCVLARRRARD